MKIFKLILVFHRERVPRKSFTSFVFSLSVCPLRVMCSPSCLGRWLNVGDLGDFVQLCTLMTVYVQLVLSPKRFTFEIQ